MIPLNRFDKVNTDTNDKHLECARLLVEAGVENPVKVLDEIIVILYGDVMK